MSHPTTTSPGSCADRGSFFEEFFAQTADMDASARAAFLQSPPAGAPDIEKAHEVWAGARVLGFCFS